MFSFCQFHTWMYWILVILHYFPFSLFFFSIETLFFPVKPPPILIFFDPLNLIRVAYWNMMGGGGLLERGQFISDHIIKDNTLFFYHPLTSQSPTVSGLLSPSTMNDETMSGSGNHSCSEFLHMESVMFKRHYVVRLLCNLWFLHSFQSPPLWCFLSRDHLRGVIQMSCLELSTS